MKRLGSVCIIFIIIMIYTGCSKVPLDNNYKDLTEVEKEKIIRELNSVKDITKEDKEKIARELYEEYLNNNRTDWRMVKAQNLNRNPVISMVDYKINEVTFVKEDKNIFTVEVSYDIQYTNESNMWLAGNGTLSENNWDKNKVTFIDIEKYLDKYIISSVYTG